MSFPYEVAQLIVDNTNIGDLDDIILVVQLFGSRVGDNPAGQLVRDRKDPVRYLRTLTNRPKEMLKAMLHTKTIVGGSRASALFAPAACGEGSDWDLYCAGDLFAVVAFTFALAEIGFSWRAPDEGEEGGPHYSDYPDCTWLNIIRGSVHTDGVTHSVQVMWTEGRSALSNVIGFHSSATQCFISGFCAVSMYHSLTRAHSSFHWGHNDRTRRGHDMQDHGREDYDTKYECSTERSASVARKYERRGFSYVPYHSLRPATSPLRLRLTRDGESYYLGFDSYIGSLEPDEATYVNLASESMRFFCWLEAEGNTRPGPTDHRYRRLVQQQGSGLTLSTVRKLYDSEDGRVADSLARMRMTGDDPRAWVYNPDIANWRDVAPWVEQFVAHPTAAIPFGTGYGFLL